MRIKLNLYGKIALERLLWLEKQYGYVVLDSHIVMPIHIHSIIERNSQLIDRDFVEIKS